MLPALASLAARRALSAGAPLMMLAASHPPAVASTSRPPRAAARALSTGARDGLDDVDRIHMRGMTFHGYHGVFAEENALGQKFVTDVTIYMDLRAAGLSDDLKDTLDYAAAYAAVRGVVEGGRGRPRAGGGGGGPCALVERVAQRCADALLAMDTRVRAVRVVVRKPHVAVEGVLESLGVEILRRRQQGTAAAASAGGTR